MQDITPQSPRAAMSAASTPKKLDSVAISHRFRQNEACYVTQ